MNMKDDTQLDNCNKLVMLFKRRVQRKMESYRVQVPADLGSVIPEIASIREDLPALC